MFISVGISKVFPFSLKDSPAFQAKNPQDHHYAKRYPRFPDPRWSHLTCYIPLIGHSPTR